MRKHKYRAKRLDNGEWAEGDLRQYINFSNYEDFYRIDTMPIEDGLGTNYDVDPNTVCEFTGKIDINKKDVYEGDIVSGNFLYAKKGIVVWDNKRCGFYIKPLSILGKASYDPYYKMNANKLEIIGNVFDNPELLGGEDVKNS